MVLSWETHFSEPEGFGVLLAEGQNPNILRFVRRSTSRMRSRISIFFLSLLVTLALLSVTVPDSRAQDAQIGVTEETSLQIDSVSTDLLDQLFYNLDELEPQSLDIHGSGFAEGAKVEFRRVFPNGTVYFITPSSEKITFVDSTLIRVNVPLELWRDDDGNVLTGKWDVRVINPDGVHGVLDDGVEVTTYHGLTREEREERDADPLDPFSLCIIATSAYGSEMAPEVQFLRGFRDETVLSTFAGRSFMDAFNSFYYSWSPGVADSIREDDQAKAFTRGMIVPLLGVLSVSSSVYVLLSFMPELGVTLTGFVVSSMLGAIYLALPMFALLRLMSRSMRRVIIRKGMVLLLVSSATGFAITSLGVYSLSSYLAMFGSATLVLSSMFAAALIVSSLILVLAGPTYLRINSMWHVMTRS